MDLLMLLAVLAVCLVGLLQPILVPIAATRRGRDGAAWFVITIIWLFFQTGLAVVVHVAGFVALTFSGSGKAEAQTMAMIALAVFTLVSCLPLVAVMVSGYKGERPVASTRRYSRGRSGRGSASRRVRRRRRIA